MIQRLKLNREQAMFAIQNGEFPEELRNVKNHVAVVMTQDWCPQWSAMSSWLGTLTEKKQEMDIDVFELVYNNVDFFDEFLSLKENQWGNALIPYVRYYINGELVRESNYLSAEAFLEVFQSLS